MKTTILNFEEVASRKLNRPYRKQHFIRGQQDEVWATYYYHYLLDMLQINNGVLTQAQVEKEIYKAVGHLLGPADLRPLKVGRVGTRAKWLNSVDWAKARLCKEGLVRLRKMTVGRVKHTFLVLLNPVFTDQGWIAWAKKAPQRTNSFKKRCPRCKTYNPLAFAECRRCGREFPAPVARLKVYPK